MILPPQETPLPAISSYHVLPISLPARPSHPTPATHYLYLHPHEPRLPTPETPRSLFLVNIPVSATEAHLKRLLAAPELGLGTGKIERVDILGGGVVRKKFNGGAGDGGAGTKEDNSSRKRKRGNKQNQNKSQRQQQDEVLEGLQAEMDGAFALPPTWDRAVNVSGAHAVVVFVDKTSLEVCLKGVGKCMRKTLKEYQQQQQQQKQKKNKEFPLSIGGVPWPEDSITSTSSTSATTAPDVPTNNDDNSPAPLGLHRYTAHRALRYPPRAALTTAVQDFMTRFAIVEAERERLANAPGAVDDDGFVTVTRGPKADTTSTTTTTTTTAPAADASEGDAAAAAAAAAGDDAAAANKKKKTNRSSDLVDFYRFQTRDKRKERELEMRKRFQQDKMRVREMRERRGNVKPE